MPRLADFKNPTYRLHKQSGQAIVTLSGHDVLLGPHGSATSRAEYDRRIAEWLAAGRQNPVARIDLTVSELIARYKLHVESYYRRPDKTPTGEAATIQHALRPLRKLYGSLAAREFSPLKLIAVRETMVKSGDGRAGRTRKSINASVNRIQQLFRWAVENELIPAEVLHGLKAVAALKEGRCDARESDPVMPVPEAYVDAVLPLVSRQVKALIELQLLTGARAGELCIMRTVDIDTAGDVWTYTPSTHKTAHRGHARVIRLGPKAQAVVKPFLKTDTHAYMFSAAEAEEERRAKRHQERIENGTPLSCGNRPGANKSRKPKRPPSDRYDVAAYRRAITRACEVAEVPHWHPHQLRHTAATRISRAHGLEMAKVILGHKHIRVTELYAEADTAKAALVMSDIG